MYIPTYLIADFIDMMYSYSFFLLFTKPTRVTGNTGTLIDDIFCNDVDCLDMMIFIMIYPTIFQYALLTLKDILQTQNNILLSAC